MTTYVRRSIGMLAACLLWATAARAAVLRASDATTSAGGTSEIVVTLFSSGDEIAGIQGDIELRRPLYLADSEACTVNPGIGKQGFFNLADCESGEPGCLRLRVLVLALDNSDPIRDGAELFRCRVSVDTGAPDGVYAVSMANTYASDPEGDPVTLTGVGGRITVGDAPTALVELDGSAAELSFFQLPVRLVDGAGAATVTVDLILSWALRVTTGIVSEPHCEAVLAGVDADFAFQPPGCSPDDDACDTMRATIHSSTALPSDAVLFQCSIFPVPVIERGDHPANCTATAAAADGAPISAFCKSDVLHLVDPTRVPTPTLPPGVTPATPGRRSPSPTAKLLATATRGPAATAADHGNGGCQIARPDDAGSILPLLLAGLLLAWRSRRAAQ